LIFLLRFDSCLVNYNTDCLYCYADRNKKDDLSVDDVLRVLDEAHKIGVVNLTLSGGDILSMPGWKDIIDRICKHRFSPFISTKVPLTRKDIYLLSQTGVESLQVSLDSVCPDTLMKMLKVKHEYFERMKEMLRFCDELHLKVNVRTVLTKYNANETEINEFYSLLSFFENISSWALTPAFYSAFKKGYSSYRASDEELINVFKLVRRKIDSARFSIFFNKMSDEKDTLKCYDSVVAFVKNNQICYANSYGMAIISNGNATICEMLYENPNFIFGNVRDKSLFELWNSPTALKFHSYKQESIRNKENNPCFSCSSYKECKLSLDKRSCYADVIKIYGNGNYEYPDPRCPNALSFSDTIIL